MPIELRQVDGVSIVVINRPKWNLLDIEMIEQLSSAFERHDPEKPVVLAGEGESFSAGVDTKAFAQYDAGRRVELAQKITAMTARILAVKAPVVAAIPGHAIGGGFVLTLCADYAWRWTTRRRDLPSVKPRRACRFRWVRWRSCGTSSMRRCSVA
jgi:enoyl-CoA hydratase